MMEPLTPDEAGGGVVATDREAALDGREGDAHARDRAADRRDDIAAKREAMLAPTGRMPSKASWLVPTSVIDLQKSGTDERTSVTKPQTGDPSRRWRSTRRPPARIVGCPPWIATSPASIAIAAPVTVPTSSPS